MNAEALHLFQAIYSANELEIPKRKKKKIHTLSVTRESHIQ